MDKKRQQAAVTIGSHPEVAEKLDQLLTRPADRAYLVCTFLECIQNDQGVCTIYTVTNPPPGSRTGPCEKYRQ